MFGNNPIRKQEKGDGQELWIQDVFYTIQGEGPFNGTPAMFVRVAGCNLQCSFCDTDFETSEWKPSLDELIESIYSKLSAASTFKDINEVATRLVVITGGEPFRQNIVPLVNKLAEDGFIVQIETAGTLTLDDFPWDNEAVHVVVSPKTPKVNLDFYGKDRVSWKYIVDAANDFDVCGLPLHTSGKNIARPDDLGEIFLQPCDQRQLIFNKANQDKALALALRHGYRISLQQHKILGVE